MLPPIENTEDSILCHCTQTSRQHISDLITSGYCSLDAISMMTGAGAGCGACQTWIEELLLAVSLSKSNAKS